MFLFFAKTVSKMRLAIFYKVKKLFLNLVHDSDCIKKNYKELQAIPSFHGIHRVEFFFDVVDTSISWVKFATTCER